MSLACQEITTTFEKIDFEHPIWETNNLIETKRRHQNTGQDKSRRIVLYEFEE